MDKKLIQLKKPEKLAKAVKDRVKYEQKPPTKVNTIQELTRVLEK